jgi:hypothetical protein
VQTAATLRELLGDRRVLNVNSTATGGGVAEMLATLIGYARGAGVETGWLVIEGDLDFFTLTKRIHNGLYGSPGDGGELGSSERASYERTLAANVARICEEARPGDVVIVHDPQPAGLIGPLIDRSATSTGAASPTPLLAWRDSSKRGSLRTDAAPSDHLHRPPLSARSALDSDPRVRDGRSERPREVPWLAAYEGEFSYRDGHEFPSRGGRCARRMAT